MGFYYDKTQHRKYTYHTTLKQNTACNVTQTIKDTLDSYIRVLLSALFYMPLYTFAECTGTDCK
jgi:hypothetical protein